MKPHERKRLPVSPEEWLSHAVSDLKLAKLGRDESDILYEQICFHAQQSVEKAFKAVLLFRKIDFPLTHDIEELIDISSEAGIAMPSEVMDAGILTPYAVETRYPGYQERITELDVNEAIIIAERVIAWAKEYIKSK